MAAEGPAQPSLTESGASSPNPPVVKRDESKDQPKASIGSTFRMKNEAPVAQKLVVALLDQETVDIPAAGNQNYIIELKEKGILQHRFPRDRISTVCEPIPMNMQNLFTGALITIRASLTRLLQLKTQLGDEDYETRLDVVATNLAIGCNLVTFMKLRALALTDVETRHNADGLRRPRAIADVPIPTAFAFAIQQLGIVNIADLTHELKFVPCLPQPGYQFGLPQTLTWNPNAYQQAVEYARSLGMRFSIVDTTVKEGTAWWLFEQSYNENVFELMCPYPESNFTEMMALAHSLYLAGDEADPSNTLLNVEDMPHGGNYGIMMQFPHLGIHLSSFEALSEAASDIWSNV
ncbi:Coat Protein [Arhar cryptic virus-I]|uniref:Coat Protein n=1 Tax=Arhar cryptic virus-I TaxID=1585924 RepID=UPI0004E03E9B|nr:Coat Protein [Arhar cryptic virus-I]CDO45229.2 Coat Protein [Arhar cryptic virus-I]